LADNETNESTFNKFSKKKTAKKNNNNKTTAIEN